MSPVSGLSAGVIAGIVVLFFVVLLVVIAVVVVVVVLLFARSGISRGELLLLLFTVYTLVYTHISLRSR